MSDEIPTTGEPVPAEEHPSAFQRARDWVSEHTGGHASSPAVPAVVVLEAEPSPEEPPPTEAVPLQGPVEPPFVPKGRPKPKAKAKPKAKVKATPVRATKAQRTGFAKAPIRASKGRSRR